VDSRTGHVGRETQDDRASFSRRNVARELSLGPAIEQLAFDAQGGRGGVAAVPDVDADFDPLVGHVDGAAHLEARRGRQGIGNQERRDESRGSDESRDGAATSRSAQR